MTDIESTNSTNKKAVLALEDFEFREEEDRIKFIFMRYYHFYVPKSELEKIGAMKVNKDSIEFDSTEKSMNNKINIILENGLDNLVSTLGKKTVYIHQNSGIPLLGTNEFGIVERDTTIIEVKAHTLCNLDCVYCSVDAGLSSAKGTDFLVDYEYLVQEFAKVASIKKKPLEASINPQGEPLMYASIIDLIRGIKAIKQVQTVSINTNGALLTPQLVDQLAEAGLDRINLSLNTLDQVAATKLAGAYYPLENVKKIVQYCGGKIEVLIAPLIVPGYNDDKLDKLIEFIKTLNPIPRLGFQNFLEYKRGRNPAKSKSMEWFAELLKEKEKKYDVKLLHTADDFNIFHDEKVPKPFRKGQTVPIKIFSTGKYPKEFLGIYENRIVTFMGNARIGETIKVKIVRDKHNIYKGVIGR